MKKITPLYLFAIVAMCSACQNNKKNENENIVSKRWVHHYGYDVSKEEWEKANYPGKVITTLRNGTTVTSSYDNGVLHGVTTYTYPHSQTIQSYSTYERGTLTKKITYDIRGIPQKEEVFLSPSHVQTTKWYHNGTPLSVEEYRGIELISAQYFNDKNEQTDTVVGGSGVKIIRDEHKNIIGKESIEHGVMTKKETFHPHGIPHTIIGFIDGKLNGEKKVFAPSGEPISSEHYLNDRLHGPATYFQNGYRYLEINYYEGLKHGRELHYVDGSELVEEIQWVFNEKHGPSTVFFDGISRITYYFNNQQVSKEKYRELCEVNDNILIMEERVTSKY